MQAPGPFESDAGELDSIARLLGDFLREYFASAPTGAVTPCLTRDQAYAALHQPRPPETGAGAAAALEMFRSEVLPRSVRTWHPLFLNQMFAGAPPLAVAADCLASMMNTTLATWEASPAATVIERDMARWLASLLGLPASAGGIFVPGGSTANLFGLAVARDRALPPEGRRAGLSGAPPAAILCSRAAHYSIGNAARLLGLGSDSLQLVETNRRLEMTVEGFHRALDACRAAGRKPLAAVFTIGLSATGGVDPLAPLLATCKSNGIHVHVDAAFGGTLALTHSGRKLIEGIEEADTVVWDAHKWMHVPLPCSALLAHNVEMLRATFENAADYLFHADGSGGLVEDLGRYSPLCVKRFDSFKLWVTWQAWGTQGFREMAESRLELTHEFAALIDESPDFETAYAPVTPIVCFRMKSEAIPVGTDADAMHEWIRTELIRRGVAFVNLTRLDGHKCFRAILINPLTRLEHLRRMIEEMRALACTYENAQS